VQLPDKPARGGIDPYNLLDWEEGDNIERIELESPRSSSHPTRSP
jgi:ABC-2 type transport system permease protein